MRFAKSIYAPFIDGKKYLNIGNIMFEYEGTFTDIEFIPDSYLKEYYGFTKEELASIITEELEYDLFADVNFGVTK
jgi:hypothetical protein